MVVRSARAALARTSVLCQSRNRTEIPSVFMRVRARGKMARGLLSSWAAALAVAGCLRATAASLPLQPCETEGGRCHLVKDEGDEGDQTSLLVRTAATRAVAGAAAAGVNGTAKCNEALFQGLCYRTCTDMAEMEPRRSPSNCGGVENYNFIQCCNEDGTSSLGAGSAPGIHGRPLGGCFGNESTSTKPPFEWMPGPMARRSARTWSRATRRKYWGRRVRHALVSK